MRGFTGKNSTKDWVRLAASLGILFTEPKVRAAITEHFKSRVNDMTDTVADKYSAASETVADKYGDAVNRLSAASDALQGRSQWPSRVTGFLLGVGVGAGLGILLAPTSGIEARESVREKMMDTKNKIRNSVSSMPFTGTEG